MNSRIVLPPLGVLALACGLAASTPTPPSIPDSQFNRLHALIQPQPGESPWREVDWLTDVTEARERSVAKNKPILIFTAADGSPLGRT